MENKLPIKKVEIEKGMTGIDAIEKLLGHPMSNEEHACYNCKFDVCSISCRPCIVCLDFGTQYPYWKSKQS